MEKNSKCLYKVGFDDGFDKGYNEGYENGYNWGYKKSLENSMSSYDDGVAYGVKKTSSRACIALINIMAGLKKEKVEMSKELQDAIHKLYYQMADTSYKNGISYYWDAVMGSADEK